jgi:hypothetical protein
MIKNLVVVVSGGALAFGLAGTVSPAIALASVASPAGVTRANLPMPDGTPIIRDSSARPGCGHPGHLRLWNPAAPPTIRDSTAQAEPPTVRDSTAQAEPPTVRDSTAQAAPPIIRDARARTRGAECGKLMNPPGTPIIRDSAARFGDPDDGGQVTQAAARFGDPDSGGQ